jgi:hypothetical protein
MRSRRFVFKWDRRSFMMTVRARGRSWNPRVRESEQPEPACEPNAKIRAQQHAIPLILRTLSVTIRFEQ